MGQRTRWSAERIVTELRELDAMGLEMSAKGVRERWKGLYTACTTYYGSFDKALEAAGLVRFRYREEEARRRMHWSASQVMATLRELDAKGLEMSSGNIKEYWSGLYKACLIYHGSFDKALEAAGLERVRYRRRWDRETIIGDIRRLHDRGEDLGHKKMLSAHSGLVSAANIHFGSWPRAVEAAGIDYSTVRKRQYMDGEIVADGLLAMHDAGEPLTYLGLIDANPSLYHAARQYFGSLDAAVEYAMESRRRKEESLPPLGVPVPILGRKRAPEMTNSQIFDALRAMADDDGIKAVDVQRRDHRLYAAILSRYGSVRAAVEAMGREGQEDGGNELSGDLRKRSVGHQS